MLCRYSLLCPANRMLCSQYNLFTKITLEENINCNDRKSSDKMKKFSLAELLLLIPKNPNVKLFV